MPHYRCYFLDSDKAIRDVAFLDCPACPDDSARGATVGLALSRSVGDRGRSALTKDAPRLLGNVGAEFKAAQDVASEPTPFRSGSKLGNGTAVSISWTAAEMEVHCRASASLPAARKCVATFSAKLTAGDP